MSTGRPVIAAGNAGYFGPVTAQNFAHGWQVYFGDHDFISLQSKTRLQKDIRDVLHKRPSTDQEVLLPAGSVPLPGGNGGLRNRGTVLSGAAG